MKLSHALFLTLFGVVLSHTHAQFVLEADGICFSGAGTGSDAAAFCSAKDLNCCNNPDRPNGGGGPPCRWNSMPVRLCSGSCVGEDACGGLSGPEVNIGPGSCATHFACTGGFGNVGAGSCIGTDSCLNTEGSIGDNSCTFQDACQYSSGVGSCVDFCGSFKRKLDENLVDQPLEQQLQCPGECPTEAPTLKVDPAGATGDPHFKTRNGHMYDFHGACDLVLLQAPEYAHGLGLDIHIRTQSRYQYSYIESAALKIGDDILEVGSWGENFFNGVEDPADSFPKIMGGVATVTHEQENKKRQRFEIILDEENKIVMRTFKDLVSVTVDKASGDALEGSKGMLGGANGQMLARDGVTVLESDPDAFGMEWQVRDTEPKIFQNMDRFPQYPQKCLMPSVSMDSRRLGEASGITEDEALEACKKEGRMSDLDGCVYDILATGDLELAQAGGF